MESRTFFLLKSCLVGREVILPTPQFPLLTTAVASMPPLPSVETAQNTLKHTQNKPCLWGHSWVTDTQTHIRRAALLRHAESTRLVLRPFPAAWSESLSWHLQAARRPLCAHTLPTATNTRLGLLVLGPRAHPLPFQGSPKSSLSRGISSTKDGMTKEKVLRLK